MDFPGFAEKKTQEIPAELPGIPAELPGKPAELPGCFFFEFFLIDLCDFQPVVVSWIPSEKTFWP